MLVKPRCLTEKWCFDAENSIISVACTSNCAFIAIATVGRSLFLLDKEGHELWSKLGKDDDLDHEAWCVAIADDASVVAVGTASKNPAIGTVYVFDFSGEQLFSQTFDAPIWSLDFSSSGKLLVASAWNGKAFRFNRSKDGYSLTDTFDSGCTSGLYGIVSSSDGLRTYVCAYDRAIIELNADFRLVRQFYTNKGLYNIDIADDTGLVVAGARSGNIVSISYGEEVCSYRAIMGVGRPLCGISVARSGNAVVCGSFDGNVYLLGHTDMPLASFETKGEVWSVACSDDLAYICVASGDHSLRLIENSCNAAALQEIKVLEDSVGEKVKDTDSVIDRLLKAYVRNGIYEYGYARLSQLKEKFSLPYRMNKRLEDLLKLALTASPDNAWAHFNLGSIFQDQKQHQRAIEHFQKAYGDPKFASKALALSADSFRSKRLPAATATCYRRAREQRDISTDSKHVLFNLGRSYEDTKQFAQAISHFQLLASWDISYRDTWDRLEHLSSVYGSEYMEVSKTRSDYTGITISLLGPDAPRDVGTVLQPVLKARTAEVMIDEGEREEVAGIIQLLRENENYCRGITGTGLDYSQRLFLKYDYSLPEDETKKFLETVNLFYLLKNKNLFRTLDIGSATGRYPSLMTWRGALANGIDIEKSAVEYARKLVPVGDEWPKYEVSDATKPLPFPCEEFDLITCMMGTFSHLFRKNQGTVIKQMFDCLKPGGSIAISTWDMECEHLAFLSIYNESQKDLIRENSPSLGEIEVLLRIAGFKEITVRSFCMLPQGVVYDLGTENLRAGDIQLIAQADLAVRSLYPKKHGEMYLAYAIK